MPKPLLNIKKLLKTRCEGRGYELYIPSLQIRQGEFWALMGQSGSGKSTALDILALILRPDSCQEFSFNTRPELGPTFDFCAASQGPKQGPKQGPEQGPEQKPEQGPNKTPQHRQASPPLAEQVYFNAAKAWAGGNLDSLANIRAKHFGYVLQIGGLLPFLNVHDNIMLARKTAALKGEGPVPELVDQLGISHLLHKKIDQISVGERQRVAIARALAHEPSLVLADEPTSALDPVTASDVLNLLISLTRKQRAALLVASHDWQAVRRAGFKELHIKVDMGPSTPENSTNKNLHNNPIRAVLRAASQEINEADSSYFLPDKPYGGPGGIADDAPHDISEAGPEAGPNGGPDWRPYGGPDGGPGGIAGGRSCEGRAIPDDLTNATLDNDPNGISNACPSKEPAEKCNPCPACNKGKEQA